MVQLVELQDGARWLTMSRTVQPQGRRYGGVHAEFAIGLGVSADLAAPLAAAKGIDLTGEGATPIGLGCRACTRVRLSPAFRPAGRPRPDRQRSRARRLPVRLRRRLAIVEVRQILRAQYRRA